MLTFNLDKDTGILEVKETQMSFHADKTTYWYYDTTKWLKSSTGKQGSTPDRVMSPEDIKWVQTYYLPKVQGV
jgi:hypothetical protein